MILIERLRACLHDISEGNTSLSPLVTKLMVSLEKSLGFLPHIACDHILKRGETIFQRATHVFLEVTN